MNKFNEAFTTATNGKFPYLRFVRAEFSNANQSLKLFFLIKSAILDDGFTEADRAEVVRICSGLLPLSNGETFSVSYVKAYADEEVVRAKFAQFLNKKEPILLQKIKPEDVTVEVNEYFINLTVNCMQNDKAILSSPEISEKLIENFNENFVENVNFNVISKYVDKTEKAELDAEKRQIYAISTENNNIIVREDGTVERPSDAFADLLESFGDEIVVYENSRLIPAKTEHCIFGSGTLSCMPGYIADIKESFESATICGTVCGLQKKAMPTRITVSRLATARDALKRMSPTNVCLYTYSTLTIRRVPFLWCVSHGITTLLQSIRCSLKDILLLQAACWVSASAANFK
jgi:hypothetical protein